VTKIEYVKVPPGVWYAGVTVFWTVVHGFVTRTGAVAL
jgi:hypothetical protein